jgi:hypothetical protein
MVPCIFERNLLVCGKNKAGTEIHFDSKSRSGGRVDFLAKVYSSIGPFQQVAKSPPGASTRGGAALPVSAPVAGARHENYSPSVCSCVGCAVFTAPLSCRASPSPEARAFENCPAESLGRHAHAVPAALGDFACVVILARWHRDACHPGSHCGTS